MSELMAVEQTACQRLLKQAEHWCEAGLIRSLDRMLAQFFLTELTDLTELELVAVLLCSEANGRGHVCLDIASLVTDSQASQTAQVTEHSELWQQANAELSSVLAEYRLVDWCQALQRSALVDNRLTGASAAAVVESTAPFVLAGTMQQPLLYMRRYWQYEQLIGAELSNRMVADDSLNTAELPALLQGLFPQAQQNIQEVAEQTVTFDWQMAACALAVRSHFGIITGGPGTGKTTTVIKLLTLLQGLRLVGQQPPLQILLAAPTGKAAARLNESIAQNLQQMDFSALPLDPVALKALLPAKVQTVHRLLGARPDSRHFKHQRQHPLAADVVVVDEASMVDVELMAALVQALPPGCRLYLLGDKDQLASVEAGSVLGDLCRYAEAGQYRPATAEYLQQVCAAAVPAEFIQQADAPMLAQVTAMLRVSYRFREGGAIHQLATLVNRGTSDDGKPVVAAVKAIAASEAAKGRVQLLQQIMRVPKQQSGHEQTAAFSEELKSLLITGYRDYLTAVADFSTGAEPDLRNLEALDILANQRNFQLLAATKDGAWGVEGLNQRIERLLAQQHLINTQGQVWYPGRPVLMMRNDYHLKLMNGDIGVCLPLEEQGQTMLRVAFPDGEGGIRWVLPSRLHDTDTVFAMTVHKSQGSEFAHTALLLPASSSPVLTRELLYTGITRAKERFTLIYDNDAVLASTISQRVQRASGFGLL